MLDDFAHSILNKTDPVDWNTAMQTEPAERAKWLASDKREWTKLLHNKTMGDWVPIKELPKDTKLVKTADVLKVKRDDELKARAVIKGFTMQPGVHFNQTFAPTVALATFRILLALAAMLDWDIWQGDAPNAFMQPEIDTEI